MKRIFALLFALCAIQVMLIAQTPTQSKLILKNNDVITGKIVEMKAGEFVKIEIIGNNVLTIPYSEIAQIIMDATAAPAPQPSTPIPTIAKGADSISNEKPLGDFYFETVNEVALGLGMGQVYGYGYDTLVFQLANKDIYGGFYTVNGVGYKKKYYVGIGIGILKHSGYSDDSNDFKYSMPFTIDMRYRPLDTKQFSPIVMLAGGASYYDGSLGTFTMLSGLGLSIRFQDRFDAQLLITHHYDRFSPNLSVENGFLESLFSGAYVNYGGARLGISYRL